MLEPEVGQLNEQSLYVNPVDVLNEKRSQRGQDAWGRCDRDRLSEYVSWALELLGRQHVRTLLEMPASEPRDGVLELRRFVWGLDAEVGRADIEKAEDREELLRGKGALTAFDLAESALGKPELVRELRLGPLSLST
jgi:hypothetical protein